MWDPVCTLCAPFDPAFARELTLNLVCREKKNPVAQGSGIRGVGAGGTSCPTVIVSLLGLNLVALDSVSILYNFLQFMLLVGSSCHIIDVK